MPIVILGYVFLLSTQMMSLVMNLIVVSITLVCYQTLIVFHSPWAKCFLGFWSLFIFGVSFQMMSLVMNLIAVSINLVRYRTLMYFIHHGQNVFGVCWYLFQTMSICHSLGLCALSNTACDSVHGYVHF